jgi:hypothetical protein
MVNKLNELKRVGALEGISNDIGSGVGVGMQSVETKKLTSTER